MSDVSIRVRAGLSLFVRQVSRRLHVPERTVRYWAATGRLRAHREGQKLWAFDEADVNALARLRRDEDVA